ncbi:hypothetical protein C8A05DRAFT_29479 [Staphylotrichum tortipilum]|uniref:RING-CH-type domain-containing protein n=1 Tax=Staphylotrichum tortipilum TaxID=2831512 RepID=A0AAN6MUB4_9PEZI|nr:hypothetical protein C8A05DRAFT_29479 [Staphylotrichum longicolle]
MATLASDAAAPVESTPAANHHVIVPAPIATADQHVCFICLQNDTDTPNAIWVNPCPCSLEAHEGCMLQWIAEMETSGTRSKGGFKCPACKASIQLEQPFDRFLAIRDRLYREYSRVSPVILLLVVAGGTVAGMSSYGYVAASVFAGTDGAGRWLGLPPRGRIPASAVPLAALKLSIIGPSLVVWRWLPPLGSFVSLPASMLYGAWLIAQENFPTWPPSSEWAFTVMPLVHLSYTFLFYDLFGPLERRLNRALRGQPPTEEPAALEEQARQAAPAPEAAAADPQGEPDGILAAFATLGRTILDLFDGRVEGEVNIEVEVDVEDGEEGLDFRIGGRGDNAHRLDDRDAIEGEDEFQILRENAARQPAPEQPRPAEAVQDQHQPAQQPAAAPPAPEAPRQNQPPVPNNNNNNNNNQNQNQRRNNNAAANARDPSLFTLLINSIVSPLLLPAISYGIGELIRAALPKSLTTPPEGRPPTGLLQKRWGRSLVGGCLFTVLRDAFALYTKYKRVQVKLKRKIKNVEKKVGRGTADGRA